MPLYEYRCDACEQVFEVLQRASRSSRRKCEECGGPLRKLVSRSGFVLKGSGWYVTDYGRGSGPAKGSESKDAPKSKGAPKESGSSDSGPAAPRGGGDD